MFVPAASALIVVSLMMGVSDVLAVSFALALPDKAYPVQVGAYDFDRLADNFKSAPLSAVKDLIVVRFNIFTRLSRSAVNLACLPSRVVSVLRRLALWRNVEARDTRHARAVYDKAVQGRSGSDEEVAVAVSGAHLPHVAVDQWISTGVQDEGYADDLPAGSGDHH
jgi:hypothetical protein